MRTGRKCTHQDVDKQVLRSGPRCLKILSRTHTCTRVSSVCAYAHEGTRSSIEAAQPVPDLPEQAMALLGLPVSERPVYLPGWLEKLRIVSRKQDRGW